MNKKQFQRFFDLANHQLFGGALPETKLQISKKSGDLLGLCQIYALKGQKIRSSKITIFPKVLAEIGIEDYFRNIVIHEMVHLYIAIKAGRAIRNAVNLFQEHDEEIFQNFADAAQALNLIEINELFN